MAAQPGAHVGLVEAKVLGARDGGLGGRRQRLASPPPRLDLGVDPLQDLRGGREAGQGRQNNGLRAGWSACWQLQLHAAGMAPCAAPSLTPVQQPVQLLATSGSSGRSSATTCQGGAGHQGRRQRPEQEGNRARERHCAIRAVRQLRSPSVERALPSLHSMPSQDTRPHLECGLRPELPSLANDVALVHAQLVDGHAASGRGRGAKRGLGGGWGGGAGSGPAGTVEAEGCSLRWATTLARRQRCHTVLLARWQAPLRSTGPRPTWSGTGCVSGSPRGRCIPHCTSPSPPCSRGRRRMDRRLARQHGRVVPSTRQATGVPARSCTSAAQPRSRPSWRPSWRPSGAAAQAPEQGVGACSPPTRARPRHLWPPLTLHTPTTHPPQGACRHQVCTLVALLLDPAPAGVARGGDGPRARLLRRPAGPCTAAVAGLQGRAKDSVVRRVIAFVLNRLQNKAVGSASREWPDNRSAPHTSAAAGERRDDRRGCSNS